MIQFRDRILVATSTGIWRLNDEMTALEPLEIVWSDAQ